MVEPKTNVFERLGPARMEEEEDEILAEALEADRKGQKKNYKPE